MIFDVAVDPALVATWTEREVLRYYNDKFGLGSNRIIARFPKHWKRLIFESFKGNDVARARLEAFVQAITETSAKRPGSVYDGKRAWHENIAIENQRRAFGLVLTQQNLDAELDRADGPWNAPTMSRVSRTPQELAKSVGSMLQLADKVLLIDPHFNALRPAYRQSLFAYVKQALINRDSQHTLQFEVHTSGSGDRKPEAIYFENDCRTELPRLIPRGQSIRIFRWLERKGGEKLHNRYILTNLGGVAFLTGLDAGPEGQTDDVMLFGRELFVQRYEQFSGTNGAYDLQCELLISGVA